MNNTDTTQQELKNMVNHIADNISNGIELTTDEHAHIMEETGQEPGDLMYASDYLADALDIQYIVSSDKQYLGARVLVAFGGPNIWINTQTGTVESYWWTDSAFASFDDNMGLDDFLSELWEC